MGASTVQRRSQASARRRHQSNVPHGTEGIPRSQPSAAALDAASAQQILEELRKQLEGVDLKAEKVEPAKRRTRKKS